MADNKSQSSSSNLTLEETDTLINLRNDFLNKYKSNIENNEYDEIDLNRIKESLIWLYAFYRHVHKKYDSALSLLNDVLKWRSQFKANDIFELNVDNELPFPNELLHKGAIFVKNKDKNGTPLVHFVVKTHKKDQYPHEKICKFIVYNFEKEYRFDWNNKIVLLFDMNEAGMSNLDMEMIKFVITCLKTYYPGLVDYMLIFQMPFIFNAAWKIIKNWLPQEAIQLIKFVDKKSIKEYVDDNQLFLHMGGTDNYKYKYEEIKDEVSRKRVSFAPLETLSKTQSEIVTNNPLKENNNNNDKQILYDDVLNDITEQNSSLTAPFLSISPGDEILFQVNDAKTDISQQINLKNTSSFALAYKIKITSPDKFRVKPGSGIINSLSDIQITIHFLKEYHNSLSHHRDKFLILWTKTDDNLKQTDLVEFWKQLIQNKTQIHEHKLKCVVVHSTETTKPVLSAIVNSNNKKINDTFLNNLNNTNKIESVNNNNVNGSTSSINAIKTELKELKTNMNELTKLQYKLNKRLKYLLLLIYILMIISLIQLLVQSNLYNNIIEPYIDSLLFSDSNSD